MSQARLLQLVAIRAQIDALIAAEGEDVGTVTVEAESCPTCGAGADQQTDTSTFGHPRRRCRRCQVERDVA